MLERGVWSIAAGSMLGLAACTALVLSGAQTAVGQTGSRQSAKVSFVEQRPGVPSGLTFDVDYVNPDDPHAKPPAVRTVVETLAPDARFDTTVPVQCPATDAQLVGMGESACPSGSKVGAGFIRIDTGFPEPNRFFDVDVTFLNNTDQLIFLSTERKTGGRVVSRAAIQGGRLTSMAPPLPGTPPDGGAIDVVHTRLDAISREVGGVRRGYITTPSVCPRGGAWTNTLSFTYADGVTQTVASQSPCVVPAPGQSPGTCKRRIDGTRRGDRLVGSSASERIRGFRGNDYLEGRGGRDCLFGGSGRDTLKGGRGADKLVGGAGQDLLSGGPGPDAIRSRDGVRDLVRCGSGRDTVRADERDRLRGCERVT